MKKNALSIMRLIAEDHDLVLESDDMDLFVDARIARVYSMYEGWDVLGAMSEHIASLYVTLASGASVEYTEDKFLFLKPYSASVCVFEGGRKGMLGAATSFAGMLFVNQDYDKTIMATRSDLYDSTGFGDLLTGYIHETLASLAMHSDTMGRTSISNSMAEDLIEAAERRYAQMVGQEVAREAERRFREAMVAIKLIGGMMEAPEASLIYMAVRAIGDLNSGRLGMGQTHSYVNFIAESINFELPDFIEYVRENTRGQE